MSVELPVVGTAFPSDPADANGMKPGGWWHADGDRIVCDLCPRVCVLKNGDRGFCFVRKNVDNRMMLTTYGRSTGFCIDPIEKKPLNHFLPGTSVLSFGTAGCNLGCKFCQNWDISKSREIERLSERAMPHHIARAAKSQGCHSVAFTYNDPIVWAEYAIDTAIACHEVGIKTVAVTAGYITEEARGPFYEHIDAANVDLKSFSEEFYYKITSSHLQPVLDTLRWLKTDTDVWFEITNLVIPDANDSADELKRMCDWVLENVGDEVPIHFSAFHPDFRMRDRERTPHETLILGREIALKVGIKHAYVGNVNDKARQSTYCPNCQQMLIERDWYQLGQYNLQGNCCRFCGHKISGRFLEKPGTWGRRRLPVDMRQFTGEQNAIADAFQQANQVLSGEGNSNTQTRRTVQDPKQGGTGMTTVAAPTGIELSEEQKQLVLAAAAEHVKAAAVGRQPQLPDLQAAGLTKEVVSGTFVSLKHDGRLRSCCGSLGRTTPLHECLQEAAHRTATNDPRFPRISPSEIGQLDVEVWLLFAPEQVPQRGADRIKAIEIGKHGLQIVCGENRGLLLPGVATDNGWDAEKFLDQVCVKASLPPTAWRDDSTTLFRFGGEVIQGKLLANGESLTALPPIYDDQQLTALAQFCRDTIDSTIRGATSLYYCPTVSDSNVNGATVVVTLPGTNQELTLSRMNIKQQMPLQHTLYALCGDLANNLRRRGFMNGKYGVDIAIAYDTAMHGTIAKPDVTQVDTKNRLLLVTERNKTGWLFDRQQSENDVLKEAASIAEVSEPEFAQVFSMRLLSTVDRVSVSSVPRAVRGESTREPAVAGSFYPADVSEMNQSLDKMLAAKVVATSCHACMVPHAGWRFSGQLAADVLQRIKFPSRIIAIGPKHTPHGLNWAVAPHHSWSIPGGSVESDYELAKKLSDAIPGLEMDAAAHQKEHGIEVELPIIARLAPETKVVGITLSGGSLERCEQFAEGLAKVVAEMDEKPLLLISSDMNHFANDQETRRLDQMALADLDRLDPDALFETVTTNHISMCGVLPAVVILKALKRLNLLRQSIQVGYSTSADVTGDTNRVVGYAGRIFN